MGTVFLSLGANMGDRSASLQKSIMLVKESIGLILSISAIYQTEPWGFVTDNWFLNQVIKVQTTLSPQEILHETQLIEKEIGRFKTSTQYESRIVDIDILFYEDWILDEPDLTIPHPHIQSRKFILIPLNEIAPDFIHPVLKKDILYLARNCNDNHSVEVLKENYELKTSSD